MMAGSADSIRASTPTVLTFVFLFAGQAMAGDPPKADRSGTVTVPAFSLPMSSLLSAADRDVLVRSRAADELSTARRKACPAGRSDLSRPADMAACQANAVYATDQYRRMRAKYPVTIDLATIAGVSVEVIQPIGGITAKNDRRVLINLHGGGFQNGARWGGHFESAPVAALSKIKVISVDYRQGPDHAFPAATDDVVSVYKALLKTHRPHDIGIYGCSAGGLLTAEVVASLEKDHLPLPGAIGMFCEGAAYWTEGESGALGEALTGGNLPGVTNSYFENVDPRDPRAFPAFSPSVMARFPPTLLISGTRDFALSSVVYTHSVLVAEGVDAELHVWEGQDHAFFYHTDLTQSDEAFTVIVRFFDRRLGR
jgi:epsilon-lactone hydrolase